jgi:hypothetical protein
LEAKEAKADTFRNQLVSLMGGTISMQDNEFNENALFECQRESSTCFYHRPTVDNQKDEPSHHDSVDNGSSSFYQNSGRPSSSSLHSALYGGIVTADGKFHKDEGVDKTGSEEFEGFNSRKNSRKDETVFTFDGTGYNN